MAVRLRSEGLITDAGILRGREVLVEEGRVRGIVPEDRVLPGVRRITAPGLIAPGFVDIHTHGFNGVSFADEKVDPEAVAEVGRQLHGHGVRAFLASFPSVAPSTVERQIARLAPLVGRRVPGHATLLGIHLEGPYLSVKNRGAHPIDLLREPDVEETRRWLDVRPGVVRMMTLAPEKAGSPEVANLLQERRVVAAFGHSEATYEETRSALASGFRHVTHLWNAMEGIHHRRPGAVSAILNDRTVTAELIADGFHSDPAILALTLGMLGPDRTVLVTDAMQAAGATDGVYRLGGQEVRVEGGVARTPEGHLAGSTLLLRRAAENLVGWGICDVATAVHMASRVPARVVGETEYGSFAVGSHFDPVVLDEKGQLLAWSGYAWEGDDR